MLGRIGVICLFTIDLFKMLRRMSLPVKKTINCSYKNNSMILKNISKFVLLQEKDDHINFRRQSSKRLELPKFCLKISRFFQSMTERMKKWFLKRSPLILKNSIFIVLVVQGEVILRIFFEMKRCVFISKVVKRARSSVLFTKLKKL